MPAVKTLESFEFSFQPSIKREQIESLHDLGFIDRKENVVLLGPPGVGKSHLAIREPKRPLLSRREQVLYHRLAEACPWHIVLCQVQLLQMLRFKRGGWNQSIANRINQLSVHASGGKSTAQRVDNTLELELHVASTACDDGRLAGGQDRQVHAWARAPRWTAARP